MSALKKILLVDDDSTLRQSLAEQLGRLEEFLTEEADTGEAALARAKEGQYDAVLLDVNLAGEPAYRVADLLTREGIPFVVATAYAPPSLPAAFDSALILRKPFAQAELKRGLEIVVSRRN